MSINDASRINGHVSLIIKKRLGRCDLYSMYWPPLLPNMLLMISLLSSKNDRQWCVNNFCSYIIDDETAVLRHSGIIDVSGAFLGKMVLMISLPLSKNVCQQSIYDFWSCILENQWAMQQYQPSIMVSAAFMRTNAIGYITTTS